MDRLGRILDSLFARVGACAELSEGRITSSGAARYRRIDHGTRALAYVLLQRRRDEIRVDLPARWWAGEPSRLRCPTRRVGVALALRSVEDVGEAIRFLLRTVELTQAAEARHAEGRERRRAR